MHPLAQRFLEAQLAGDRSAALRVVVDDGLRGGMSVPELHTKVIRAAQLEIGRLWEENLVTVAQEHLATAIAQLALARLYPHLPREADNGKKLLLACVDGELHDMGPRIAADFLEMAGFEVRFLGASVPAESLVAMVKSEKPDAVVLSITLPIHAASLRATVKALRDAGLALPIIAGGHALHWDPALARGVDLAGTGGDAEELVAAARSLLLRKTA